MKRDDLDTPRRGTLALGNLSGTMMIQATIASALGIVFTPWLLDPPLIVAASVTFLAISAAETRIARRQKTRRVWAAISGLRGGYRMAIGMASVPDTARP